MKNRIERIGSLNKKQAVYKNKRIFASLFIILAVLILVTVSYFKLAAQREYAVAFTVNGNAVVNSEFKQRLNSASAGVFSYFNKKYGAEDSEDFWSYDFNGEIPNVIAKKNALDECVRIKVQQELAKKKGILKDLSYQGFQKALKEENHRRKTAVKEGKVIYGPEQYGEVEYFNYVFSNMVIGLKQSLQGKEIQLGDKELREYYEANKDSKYRLPNSISIQRISIKFISKDGSLDKAKLKVAKERINETKARLDKGESFEAVEQEYNEGGVLLEHRFEPQDYRSNIISFPEIYNAATGMKKGEISPVIKTNTDFNIIKCVENKYMGYEPYESLIDSIKSELLDIKYKELVEKLVKEAKVEVDEKVYKKIVVR